MMNLEGDHQSGPVIRSLRLGAPSLTYPEWNTDHVGAFHPQGLAERCIDRSSCDVIAAFVVAVHGPKK
jgi:hypothetical protein